MHGIELGIGESRIKGLIPMFGCPMNWVLELSNQFHAWIGDEKITHYSFPSSRRRKRAESRLSQPYPPAETAVAPSPQQLVAGGPSPQKLVAGTAPSPISSSPRAGPRTSTPRAPCRSQRDHAPVASAPNASTQRSLLAPPRSARC